MKLIIILNKSSLKSANVQFETLNVGGNSNDWLRLFGRHANLATGDWATKLRVRLSASVRSVTRYFRRPVDCCPVVCRPFGVSSWWMAIEGVNIWQTAVMVNFFGICVARLHPLKSTRMGLCTLYLTFSACCLLQIARRCGRTGWQLLYSKRAEIVQKIHVKIQIVRKICVCMQ